MPSKPYAVILMKSNNQEQDILDGMERLILRIKRDKLSPNSFLFHYWDCLPKHLEDSFTISFQKSALMVNKQCFCIEANYA